MYVTVLTIRLNCYRCNINQKVGYAIKNKLLKKQSTTSMVASYSNYPSLLEQLPVYSSN